MNENAYDKFTPRGKAIADLIVAELNEVGIEARVGKTWKDYGSRWSWDTVLVGPEDNAYQALNPRQFDDMNSGDFNFAEIKEIVSTAQRLVK